VSEAAARRPYRLGRRREQVESNRRRIIEAARELFAEDGFHGVGLEEVARRAGVGRKTIYNQFGSKRDLFQAVVDDLGERGGVGQFMAEAFAEADAGAAIDRVIEGCTALWEAEAVAGVIAALAATDAEAREVLVPVYASRRDDLRRLAARAGRSGALRPGWTAARVADTWWLLTSPEAYLVQRRAGRGAAEARRILLDLAHAALESREEERS
jgi:AcrR family transcriptional regulator